MAGRDLEAQGKHFETFVKKKARWFEEVAKESTLSCVDSRSGADGASPGYTAARQVRQLRDDAAYQNPQLQQDGLNVETSDHEKGRWTRVHL